MSNNANNKVYLSGLPVDSDEGSVRECLVLAGVLSEAENGTNEAVTASVSSIVVKKSSGSGPSPSESCYAFVELADAGEASEAITKLNGNDP